MSGLSTEEFNEIYKRNFREYFDKPLKKDGFYKKGTINFYRLNRLGMLECLNFQRHYEGLTVNCSLKQIYCDSTKTSAEIGKRLGEFSKPSFPDYPYDTWWDVKDDTVMKKSMSEMLGVIRTNLYEWFESLEDEKEITEVISNSYKSTIVYRYILQVATAAKFKKYDEILPYIEKVRQEYKERYDREEKERYKWLKNITEEALLLEQKVGEGEESVDKYIIERERQSLIEIGLEKLLIKK